MGLLDRYDPLFGLEYLLPPPYNTAGEVAEVIEEAIIKAQRATEQYNDIQNTDCKRP